MDIGDTLRQLREVRELSQGELEKRTGLLRCYISRVENGHTIPTIETIEKMARALEIPLYALFYGEEPSELPEQRGINEDWASHGKGARYFAKLRRALSQTSEADRELLMHIVRKVASS